jgi:lipopolysaccharide cholinephosphotransferase
MLSEFHDFCVENDLTYYMVGGTLLGAVREKGFIPWDDDVDLAMPREDYTRFLRTYQGSMLVEAPGSNQERCFPYTKLFYKDIPLVRVIDDTFSMRGNVMVQFDLYPIDGLGADYKRAQRMVKRIGRYKYLLYLNQSGGLSKNMLKNVALAVIRKLPGAYLAKCVDRAMRRCGKKKNAFVTRWREGTRNGNVVAAEVFGKPVLLPFDRLHLYAPQNYHTYLTDTYGDYQIPRKLNENLRHAVGKS